MARKGSRWNSTRAEIFWTRCRELGIPMMCVYCNRTVSRNVHDLSERRATVDHVVPLSKGGTNHFTNLVIACRPCNHAKGNNEI